MRRQSQRRGAEQRAAPLAIGPIAAITAGLGVFLLVTAQQWGYHGDELYFLAAGRHLNVSYADQPPLLPLMARLADSVFAGSLLGLRLPAIALTTAGVLVTALIARELGGRRRAQAMAAATYAVSPQVAIGGRLLVTPTVDIFFCGVLTLLLIRWARCRHDRILLWAGVVVALALQTKYLLALFCLACLASALVVGPRTLLRRPLLWMAAALTMLTTLPSLVWQYEHGWPQLELLDVVPREVSHVGGRLSFLPLAELNAGIVAGAVLAGYGLARLLRAPYLRGYRFLGVTCTVVTAVFLAAGGRYYYCAGYFPLCWAVAAADCQWFPPARWWRWLVSWPSVALSATLMVTLGAVAPLPWARSTVNYLASETGGWQELVSTVAGTYRRLPPQIASTAIVLTEHYWQASALDRFGSRQGLPHPYSFSRGYWYLGRPPERSGAVLFVGSDPEPLRRSCRPLATIATIRGVAVNKIWLCTGPHPSWSALWPTLRQP